MTSLSLAQWLKRLESLHPKQIDLGLERVAGVAKKLDLLHWEQPVISVAGTNGKGSTVAVMEAVLLAAGKRPGVYTSPHLLRFNERIRIRGQDASDAEIVAALEAIEAARGETSLTYFEFATLAALWIFRARQVDVMLLEVGLGGRLDAVNMIDADMAVITSIDLDHQEWLGHDLDTIAREKAGIMRASRPVVIASSHGRLALEQHARATGAAPVLRLGAEFGIDREGDDWVPRLWREGSNFAPLPAQPQGALLPENICTALQALVLNEGELSADAMAAGLARVAVPGRRQRVMHAGREYLLDVAHNPASVNKLLEYIDATYCNKRLFALFSVMGDKDIPGMVRAAAGHFAHWFVADQPQVPRAARAEDLAATIRNEGQGVTNLNSDIPGALVQLQEILEESDQLVIFGSFFTVAEALAWLHGPADRRAP